VVVSGSAEEDAGGMTVAVVAVVDRVDFKVVVVEIDAGGIVVVVVGTGIAFVVVVVVVAGAGVVAVVGATVVVVVDVVVLLVVVVTGPLGHKCVANLAQQPPRQAVKQLVSP